MLIIAVTSFAQLDLGFSLAFPREIVNQCNSAAVASGVTWFNADFIDTLNDAPVLPVNSARVIASTDAGSTWLSAINMTNIGGTHYADTWQASRTNAGSGSVEYYFDCTTESTFATQCPDNVPTSNPLAENRRVFLGSGDFNNLVADGRSWNTYDIQNFYGGYDDTYFYFHVTLAGGWQDRHNSLFPYYNYYHIMAIPILNNESEFRDSLFYAVVIADMNLLVVNIQDGLYKFWKPGPDDDDPLDNYTRLGAVTFSSGPNGSSSFTVRVPISLLTNDDWGVWPNQSRAIGTGCATVTAWLSGLTDFQYQIMDVTRAAGMYCYTNNYTIGTNTAPTLAPAVSSSFNRDSVWVDFSCNYTDANNNLPTVKQLEVNNGSVTTYYPGSSDHRYVDGSNFTQSVLYRCAWVDTIQYRWTFNDGAGAVNTGWLKHAMPDEIDLILSRSSWTVPDTLMPLETVMMTASDYISITNAGTVPVDLGLVVSDVPPGWILDDHVAWDTTTVFGQFNTSTTPPAFDDNHLLSNTLTWATGPILGMGEGVSYCVDGANSQNLWFKFVVPRYYTGIGAQSIRVQLWARTDLP